MVNNFSAARWSPIPSGVWTLDSLGNSAGSAFNNGVGFGGVSASPGSDNVYRGNVFCGHKKMKKFSVGRWGQIHLLGVDRTRSTRWTVRAVFLVLVAAVMVLVLIASS